MAATFINTTENPILPGRLHHDYPYLNLLRGERLAVDRRRERHLTGTFNAANYTVSENVVAGLALT